MLDLHCRQKEPFQKTQNLHIDVVARQQQEFYTQVIHNLILKTLDNLCVICGANQNKSEYLSIGNFNDFYISEKYKLYDLKTYQKYISATKAT